MAQEYESRKDKEAGGEIVVSNRFVKWWDNFWYHYKWTVIAVAFFVLVFAVCFVQCSQRTLSDTYVTFSGGFVLSEEENTAVSQVLTGLTKTEEGDSKSVGIRSYAFFSEEELRTLYTDPETGNFDNAGFNRAKQANADRFSSLQDYMMTGECSIWFLSPTVYEELKMKEDIGVSLETTFGKRPDSAYDDYAVRLGDTELYRYYEALQVLPEDTLVVLSASFVFGASSDEGQYAHVKDLYRAIVTFTAPN